MEELSTVEAAKAPRVNARPRQPEPNQRENLTMTTYTIAIGDDMLLATVPDGDDIHAAVERFADETGYTMATPFKVIRHCTLTDEPLDEEFYDIAWKSGNSGWLIDETGADWRYAVTVA